MRETILLAENISEDVSSSCEQTNLFLLHLQCQNRISLSPKSSLIEGMVMVGLDMKMICH